MSTKHLLAPVALVLMLVSVPGRSQCGGNGANADLGTTPFAIGTTETLTVSGGAGQFYAVFISSNHSTLTIPGAGTVCLDLFAPVFGQFLEGLVPPNGSIAFPFPIPNDPNLTYGLAFIQGILSDPTHPSGAGITQAHRVDFEIPDSHVPMPVLAETRALASGNLLQDGRVLVAGGGAGWILTPIGTDTCEIFDPYTRTITPGPVMSTPRAFHTGTLLGDGRVLACGGVVSLTGMVTATCEIYDPATNAWTTVAPMSVARAAHTAILLGDGRVFVAGGTSSFGGTIGQILNASSNGAEVFDSTAGPSGSWTPVSNPMASQRFLAAATLLGDGRVLITGGINGATSLFGNDIPTVTATSNTYDPVANSFSTAPSLPTAVVGHQMTTLPGGNVWSTGGASAGFLSAPSAIAATQIFNGTSWSAGPTLPQPIAMHGQILLQNGEVQIFAGLTGSLAATSAVVESVRFDGTILTPKANLPDARGAHVAVLLESGAVFLAGGGNMWGVAVDTALLYTPDP